MIVSHDKKFIFCHIPKTAGTSITKTLKPYTNYLEQHWTSRVTRKIFGLNHIPYKMINFQNYPHWSLLKASEILPKDIFDNYYKFSFVRHPILWQYSIYRHILRHVEIESFQERYPFVYKNRSFDDYIAWRIEMGAIPQVIQLIDKEGNLMVNDVFHYEELQQDFEKLCTILNITATLPHFNKNESVVTDEISNQSKQLILEHYKVDFEVFGYTENAIDSQFIFDPKQNFPNLIALLHKVKLSNFDAWDINKI